MITLIVADDKSIRAAHIASIIGAQADAELLEYDTDQGELRDLEQYLYPSLFSVAPPLIHVKFALTEGSEALTTSFIKQLIASPTVFIFEEMSVSASLATTFKKAGAVVHTESTKQVIKKPGADTFALASAIITAPDKKSRWMAYQRALEGNSIEAIIGIMYWKVRDMASKGGAKYQSLYRALLEAHASAWQSGTPLELAIEKVLLTV